jgi:translocation and assembly module TamA
MRFWLLLTIFVSLMPMILDAALPENNDSVKPSESATLSTNKQVQENKDAVKTNLASIEITGINDELKKNIELHMPVTIPECLADRAEVRQFFTTVKKNLRKATRALGYYDAEFVSSGKIVSGCWKLGLKVTPGKATRVYKQNIKVIGEGAKDKGFVKLLKELPYKEGDILNHEKYSNFKSLLSELSQSLGYFDAEFEEHSISVNPISYRASIDLILNTGKRYQYGEVKVEQKLLSKAAMDKYLLVKTGEPFSAEELINQQQILQASGYFKLIKINVQYKQAKDLKVPIEILLTRNKRNAYKFKLGYGTDTGGRISGELNRRWTGSKGRKLQLKAQYSEKLSGVSAQLINPRKNPTDNSLIHNFDIKKDTNDDVDSNSISLGSKLVRKRPNNWKQSLLLEYLRDQTTVVGEDQTNSTLILFGLGLDKVKSNNLLFPDKGWRFKFSAKAAAKALLSNQNVFQIKASAKTIYPIGNGKILSRINLGTTFVNDFNSLPKSLRFFAGGSNSVRGYSFESLGEENSNGRVVGGKNLLDTSLEYQHPVFKDWSAAAFIDAGNAFDDWRNPKINVGVGFGARWRSPIGPVRIDIGFPEGRFKEPQLHLSVGSDL